MTTQHLSSEQECLNSSVCLSVQSSTGRPLSCSARTCSQPPEHRKGTSLASLSSCGSLCLAPRPAPTTTWTWSPRVSAAPPPPNCVLHLTNRRPSCLEIIMQLRTPFCGNLLRPLLPEQSSDEKISSLLRTCWSEDPLLRPPFGCIKRHLRDTSQDQ